MTVGAILQTNEKYVTFPMRMNGGMYAQAGAGGGGGLVAKSYLTLLLPYG